MYGNNNERNERDFSNMSKHKKIAHLRPISNQSGRMNKTYGTCKDCKKEGKEKICHVFKTKNS